jgi:hypothetical protein
MFGLPTWILTIIIVACVSLLFNGLLFAFLIITYAVTPAARFLIAKLRRLPMLAIFTPNGLHLEPGKNADSGVAETKGLGFHLLTPGTGIPEKKSGVRFFFSNFDFGSTMPADFPELVARIQEDFKVQLKSTKDFEDFIKLHENDEKPYMLKYAGKSIKMTELSHLWPFNLNPSMIENKCQYKVMEKMKSWGKQAFPWLIAGGFLVMAAIAFVIIMGMKGNSPACNMNINPETLAAMCKGAAQTAANTVAPTVGLQG